MSADCISPTRCGMRPRLARLGRGVRHAAVLVGVLFAASVSLVGCHDLSGTQPLPAGTSDPGKLKTARGAEQMALSARVQFQSALAQYISASGLLTDELQSISVAQNNIKITNGVIPADMLVDARLLDQTAAWNAATPPATNEVYSELQQVRSLARQAIGALVQYVPDSSAFRRGELYALLGYSEIMLADLFCSGVPLSTLDYNGDYTYQPGSTTQQIYQHAITLFDTALTLAADSALVANLARVGQGRAYLALGQYADAGHAVADVPVTFTYIDSLYTCDNDCAYSPVSQGGDSLAATRAVFDLFQFGSVADQEGGTGYPYITSGDPRTTSTLIDPDEESGLYWPTKYVYRGINAVVLASGIEAQLIQAEAALQAGDNATWLADLNQLRTSGAGGSLPPAIVADTLGITNCSESILCGTDPGGNTPDMGEPPGGFRVPNGYTFVRVDTTYPAPPGIADQCYNNSWYIPCYDGDSLIVYVYQSAPRTQWNSGTGGVSGLAPLDDPGTVDGRIALMFNERAAWLFLTGERQGDLRRLVRVYRRTDVYPTGPYPGVGLYGGYVDAPIPAAELYNPLFHGCLNRD